MDPDFRAAVLQSIEQVSDSSDRFRVPELYKSAIKKWRRPSQEADRMKACDGLYLWYIAEPGLMVTERDFKRCPDPWKESIWLTDVAFERVARDEHYRKLFVNACDSLYAKLAYEFDELPAPPHFENCPEEAREKYFGTSDRNYLPIVKVAPIVPFNARDRCQSGWVKLRFDIATNGRPQDVEVVESSGWIFEETSVEAAEKFMYMPAREEGVLVETRDVIHKFTFDLEC